MGHFHPGRVLGIVAMTMGVAGQASAQDTSAGRQEATADVDRLSAARTAFEEGIQFGKQARWAEALVAFQRSQNLRPHAVTLYNVGFCELSLGRYTRAKSAFLAAFRDAANLPEDLRKSAEQYLSDAERSLAEVELSVTPPDSQVRIDGAPLEAIPGTEVMLAHTLSTGPGEPVPKGRVRVQLDPGEHVIELDAGRGYGAVRRSFAAGARASMLLTAPAPRAKSDGAEPQRKGTAAPSLEAPSRVPAFIAFGVGAAGFLTGGVAGALALDKRGKLDSQCPNGKCPPGEASSNLDAANTAATVATVGFGVGLAGAAVGAYLWFDASPPRARVTGLVVEPSIGLGTAGLRGRF